MKERAGVGSNCYGGWAITNMIEIDPMMSYDVSIWTKSTGPDLNHFVGFFLFDKNHQVIKEGKYGNPYFQTTDGHQPGVWEYHQNRLLSADTADSVNGDGTTGKDWLLLKNAKYMVLRFGVCYGDNDGKGESWFAFPKVAERFPESGLAPVPHKINFMGRWDIPVDKQMG